MNVALYLTIWIALCLFAAGSFARARMGDRTAAQAWPWLAWIAGITLCAIHFALAFHVRHDWSQEAAVRATAQQTASMFGLDWGGGVYVNYVFLAAWAADAWHWRQGRGVLATPRAQLLLRVFYVVIILNAAVIFAGGWRRLVGLAIVATLLTGMRRRR